MKPHISIALALLFLGAGCTPVISRAPIKSTPDDAFACATGLLQSMGYDVLDHDSGIRAERSKHAAFGRQQRADYDRVTIAVIGDQLHVRGETVAMSGGNRAVPSRGGVDRTAGGTTMTWPSRELRADVKRIAAGCGGA